MIKRIHKTIVSLYKNMPIGIFQIPTPENATENLYEFMNLKLFCNTLY